LAQGSIPAPRAVRPARWYISRERASLAGGCAGGPCRNHSGCRAAPGRRGADGRAGVVAV